MLNISNSVNRVFIILGSSCNLNCRYCMQHALVTKQITNSINPKIYEFLKQLAQQMQEKKTHLVFYGGEPFIYFNNIKEIVDSTKSYCTFSAISNGKAITEEIANYCTDNRIHVTLSWDGKNVLKTRGYDALQDYVHSPLLHLGSMSLSAVLSAYAYPLEILESFAKIQEIYHGCLSTNIDIIFDTGCAEKDLLDIDYDRLHTEMQDLCRYYARITDSYKVRPFNYIEPYLEHTKISFIDSLLHHIKADTVRCSCGNGYTVLNMDLQGNLYNCHNDRQVIGTIDSNYDDYIAKVKEFDICRTDIPAHCKDCSVFPLCKGGCKLIPFTNKISTDFCKLRKCIYEPVLELKKLIDKREQ